MRYLSILIILIATSLHAGSIQKWVDEEGNVHYGDAPPVNADTQSIRVQSAPTNPGRALPRLDTSSDSSASDASEDEDAQVADQKKINCDRANRNLSTLTSGGRIKLTEPDGNSRYLDAQEIAERTIQAENDVKTYCK